MGGLGDSHSLAAPPVGCHEYSQMKTSLSSQPTAGGVPSPVPRGCFGRKARWSAGEAARPLHTQPRLRSHLPTRRCDLHALSHSLLDSSPPPLSCWFTFATALPQLPGSHWLHQVRCWLAPSRRGWERAGPHPPPRILAMDIPAPLQCCIFKSPPGCDPPPCAPDSPRPHRWQGPKGLGRKSPTEMTPQLPAPAAPTPSPG